MLNVGAISAKIKQISTWFWLLTRDWLPILNAGFYFLHAGLVSGFTEVNRLYSVDLYDTTVDYHDVRISDEFIKSQLMWPDMSMNNSDDSEDQGKFVKHKVQAV